MKKRAWVLGCCSLLFVNTVFAGVGDDLSSYFTSLGENVNVTNPLVYKGQQAGYYTGGSLTARSSVRNLQIMAVNLPSVRSGCGGIDAFAGGFSFVDSEALVEVMRNVLNNAKGYAFTLALETITPQIANTLKYMQDMANKINQSNINSCEMSEALVGGLAAKLRPAQQKVCQEVGLRSGKFKDWVQARQGCTSGNQFNASIQAGGKYNIYKNALLANSNMAWHALQANGLTKDTELAELMLSLSGSMIIQANEAGTQLRSLPSLASDARLLKAILSGGTAPSYRCGSDLGTCLAPYLGTVTIPADKGLKSQVSALLAGIREHIASDTALTDAQIGLLQATRIPLYKIFNVQAAYQQDSGLLDVNSYADVIALDLLFAYLQDSLKAVQAASATLQYPESFMTEFARGIEIALAGLRAEQAHLQNHITTAAQLIQQSQVLEQGLAGALSTELGNQLE